MIHSGFERNFVYDKADGSLAANDSLLRLRKYDRVTLTYKGPRQGRGDRVKSRTEIEVEVADADGADELLRALGFVRAWVYEKMREEWVIGTTKICLDVLPRIGDFVEVEGASRDEVTGVLEKLGIALGDVTPQTYREVFREFMSGADDGLPDLVFEGEEAR